MREGKKSTLDAGFSSTSGSGKIHQPVVAAALRLGTAGEGKRAGALPGAVYCKSLPQVKPIAKSNLLPLPALQERLTGVRTAGKAVAAGALFGRLW